jgi:RND family efflux transporter MFP subunit
MNSKRLVTILLVTAILFSGVSILMNSAFASDGSVVQAPENDSQAQTEVAAVPVQTVKAAKDHVSTVDLVGTVKANDQVKVFSTAAGQITQILVAEGQTVKKGDPLFTVGGINGTKPIALIQLEIAQANYDAAKKGINLTKQGNEAALRASELQLESARHAAQGSYIDMQVFDQNINGVRNGLYYLNDSLNATQENNDLSLEKTANAINDLEDAIDDLEDQKAKLEEMIETQGDASESGLQQSAGQQTTGTGGASGTGSSAAATDPATLLAELDKTIDELETQLETARIGYKQLEQAKVLTENQILGQIATSETTGMVLNLNRDSAATKMGLYDGATDAVRLAEEGLNGAKIKNQASLLASQTQLNLASSNLEMARIQADALTVRAPADGVAGEVSANVGDIVSQASLLTQISGRNNYELRTAVDAESADLIVAGKSAEVMIGNKYVKLPVKSVGAYADSATRLVSVSIALPNLKFRANQTLKIRLSLEHGNSTSDADSFFIPLDALIIGTEEKYVFIVADGKAQRKVVETGDVHGDQVEIIKGLSQDDLVITEGSKTILEGQKVLNA